MSGEAYMNPQTALCIAGVEDGACKHRLQAVHPDEHYTGPLCSATRAVHGTVLWELEIDSGQFPAIPWVQQSFGS
jgi:hypothetical protein